MLFIPVSSDFVLAVPQLEARSHERGLHLVGREVRVLLQQQRHRARRHRGGLGRPAAAESRSPTRPPGNAWSMSEPGARKLDDRTAGRDHVRAAAQRRRGWRSRRRCRRPASGVPLVSDAPTASTNGSFAGSSSGAASLPSLPAETTTTMPCSRRSRRRTQRVELVVLHAVGAVRQVEHPDVEPAGRCGAATTQSIAGDHLRDVDRAVGAGDLHVDHPRAGRDPTKLRFASWRACAGSSGTDGSWPAMMPAMCVPWPNVSSGSVAGPERQVGPVDHVGRRTRHRRDAGVDQGDSMPRPCSRPSMRRRADVLRDRIQRTRDLLRVVQRGVETDVDALHHADNARKRAIRSS